MLNRSLFEGMVVAHWVAANLDVAEQRFRRANAYAIHLDRAKILELAGDDRELPGELTGKRLEAAEQEFGKYGGGPGRGIATFARSSRRSRISGARSRGKACGYSYAPNTTTTTKSCTRPHRRSWERSLASTRYAMVREEWSFASGRARSGLRTPFSARSSATAISWGYWLATSSSAKSEICRADWRDIGLEIDFVNLGGSNPCGAQGAVGGATVGGLEAEQAGWQTNAGARIGTTEDELLDLYPKMEPSTLDETQPEFRGRLFYLVRRPSPIGDEGSIPSLGARLDQGTVTSIDLYVGAGGE